MKKFVVVGAGILGASTAYQLSKTSEVVIVDRNEPGQATDAAAGIICPWLTQRRNQAWYQLAKEGARFYPSLIEELEHYGERDTGYARVGALSLQKDPEKLKKLLQRALKRREDTPEIGVINEKNRDETTELFPPLHEEFSSIHVSGAARVDGRALRDSLIRAAKKNGATLINGDAHLLFHQNRVTGVKIANQDIPADAVIVCAGAWANQLLQPLGVNFQVHFQKAQIVHLSLPSADTNQWPVLMPPGNQYILAFDDGRVVAGATHEDTEEFDTRVTAGGLEEVLNKMLETAPGLANGTFVEARTGFRPFTPGFLPVFGPLPDREGILIGNGLGASGLTMGPYIGLQLAKLALGEKADVDLSLYRVEQALDE